MSETVKIVLGYVISFGYAALVLVVGELLNRVFKIDKELSRKITHLLSGACWVICYFFTGPTIHTVIINAVSLVLLAAAVFAGKVKYADRDDTSGGKSYGIVYFAFSTLVVMMIAVFMHDLTLYIYTGVAYYCLVLGDGLAPIGGRIMGKHNIKVFGNKTLAGAVVVFGVCSLVAFVFDCFFKLGFDPLFIVSLGALACVAELIGARGTDNIVLEFAVFGYLALNYYGLASVALQVTLIICAPLFMVDSVLGVLTPAANILSYAYLLISVFCLDFLFLVTVMSLFVAEGVISFVTTRAFNKRSKRAAVEGDTTVAESAAADCFEIVEATNSACPENVTEAAPAKNAGNGEKHTRGFLQIFVNSILVLIFTVLYYYIRNPILCYTAIAVIVEEFADSMASDIGRLSQNPPLDILRFKKMIPGISGGVSILGTGSALVCAAAGAALPFIFLAFDYRAFLIIFLLAFFGTIVDSVLGSGVQALFKCDVCGEVTERTAHCGSPANLIKGVKLINNSMVNLLSAAVCAALVVSVMFMCGIA